MGLSKSDFTCDNRVSCRSTKIQWNLSYFLSQFYITDVERIFGGESLADPTIILGGHSVFAPLVHHFDTVTACSKISNSSKTLLWISHHM